MSAKMNLMIMMKNNAALQEKKSFAQNRFLSNFESQVQAENVRVSLRKGATLTGSNDNQFLIFDFLIRTVK